MKLCTTIQSEKGKSVIKTANEFIFQELTVKGIKVAEIELYFFNDSMNGKLKTQDEWLIKFRRSARQGENQEDIDWDIITQGNI